jgi:hypothetical protein
MSISHPLNINLVIIRMCSNPLDEYDPMRIVDRHRQPVVIALDVENLSFAKILSAFDFNRIQHCISHAKCRSNVA